MPLVLDIYAHKGIALSRLWASVIALRASGHWVASALPRDDEVLSLCLAMTEVCCVAVIANVVKQPRGFCGVC